MGSSIPNSNMGKDSKKGLNKGPQKNLKINTPFIVLLSSVTLLALLGIFGTLHFYQKTSRAQKELASLHVEAEKETKEKEKLIKQLSEEKKQQEIIARTRVAKQLRIDPLEAAFLENGSVPAANEPDSRIITHGNRNEKKVAITIDDGWNADNRILTLMESYDIKCTAFVIGGRNVGETHKTWLKRMNAAGFELCTHTYSHYLVTGLTNKELKRDIEKGQQVLTKVTGKTYPFLRTCGGAYNERTLDVIADSGYKLVLWDVELGDTFKDASVDSEVQRVLKNVKNGSIMLCHFGGYHTYEALKIIIPELQKRGYKITTVTDVLKKD